MSEKKLHITVAAAPNIEPGNPRLLEHDLRLTKASILYGDKVKLCSMTAWMATSFHLIGNLPMNTVQRFEIMMNFAPAIASLNPDTVNLFEFEKMHRLLKLKPILLTKNERLKISRFKDSFPVIWEKLSEGFNETLSKFGFDEIELAAQKGLLEVHPFTSSISDEAVQEYFSVVEDMLSSPETRPMLDEQTNNLVRLALQEGKISIGNNAVRRSKQIGLVAELFDRLPVFDIKMDELLDLREELQKPLTKFRAEMINLSKDIESASWDKDFASDVQDTVQVKVEPSLQEIEEKLKSTEFRDFWNKRLVDKYEYLAWGFGGSYVLGAAISPLAGVGAALLSTSTFIKAGQTELREKINEIEKNGLYFYHQLKRHVDKNS